MPFKKGNQNWKYRKDYRDPITRECLICKKEFKVIWARRYKNYCSSECGYRGVSDRRKLNNPGGFRKTINPVNKDKHYNALHHWIYRNFEKSDTCEICGKNNLSGRYINWANKNGIYNRERKNWIRLCKKCHYWYDHRNV